MCLKTSIISSLLLCVISAESTNLVVSSFEGTTHETPSSITCYYATSKLPNADTKSFEFPKTNPITTGDNPSENCLLLTSGTGPRWWANLIHIIPTTAIDITDNNRYLHFFHMRAGSFFTRGIVYVWDNTNTQKTLYFDYTTEQNVWNDMVIDLKSAFGGKDYKLARFQILPNNAPGGANCEYYFDEIVLSDKKQIRKNYAGPAIAEKGSYLKNITTELNKVWPANRTINLLFHGHSVPAGYFNTPTVKSFEAYPLVSLKLLKDKYISAVVNAINTSIGGEDSKLGATRFDSEVLVRKPDVIFIDYSLNDRRLSLEEAKIAWTEMIEKALEENLKIILFTPTPDTSVNILDDETVLAAHAKQVRELAATYHVGLVDSYALFKDIVVKGGNLEEYMAQSNHPNEKGHRIVANEIITWFLSADN